MRSFSPMHAVPLCPNNTTAAVLHSNAHLIAARLPSPFHACAASGAYHWLLLCSRPPSFLIFVYTQVHALHNMASHTARSKKIVKEKGAEPDEFEESVAQVRLGVGRSSTIRLRTPPLTGNVEMEQALFDLEATNTELKADLRDLYITSAREIDIRDSTRKAIIVHVSGGANSALLRGGEKWQPTPTAGWVTHKTAAQRDQTRAEPRPSSLNWAQVPYRLLKAFHKIQQRLVRELEKKFSGKDVVLIANRRILPPSSTGKATDRPRSRTLTAVRHACPWMPA